MTAVKVKGPQSSSFHNVLCSVGPWGCLLMYLFVSSKRIKTIKPSCCVKALEDRRDLLHESEVSVPF